MKGEEVIPAFIYITVALFVGLMMILMISKYSTSFFQEKKNITIKGNDEKISERLAKIIEECWEDNRKGLEELSSVCKEVNFENSLQIKEKNINKFLNCKILPNFNCYDPDTSDDCSSCSSEYFDDNDKIIWLAEPTNKWISIRYDGGERKIMVFGGPCDDNCLCKRNCKKCFLQGTCDMTCFGEC